MMNEEKQQQLSQTLLQISEAVVKNYERSRQQYKIRDSTIKSYTYVYQMCCQKPSRQQLMLQKYLLALQEHINRNKRIVAGPSAVEKYAKLWDIYISYMFCLVKRIFIYLDRYYMHGTEHGSLTRAGLWVFHKMVTTPQKSIVFDSYVQNLAKIRFDRIVSSPYMIKLSESLVLMNNNSLLHELIAQFFKQAESYYDKHFETNKHLPPVQYLNDFWNLFFFQKAVFFTCLCFKFQGSTIYDVYRNHLTNKYNAVLIEHSQGLRNMLQNRQIHSLRTVMKIYTQLDTISPIRSFYYDYIVSQGDKIFAEKYADADENTIINAAFDFYQRQLDTITKAFPNLKQMKVSLDNGFQASLVKINKFSQFLFNFCRQILDSNKFEINQEKIKILFQKLANKDEFIQFYQISLQNKILNNDLISEIQKCFIDFMNKICGSTITIHLLKKIDDFIIENQQSNTNLVQKQSLNVSFAINIKILALQYWENKFMDQIILQFQVVEPLLKIWDCLKEKYCDEHKKKKLLMLPFQNKLLLKLHLQNKPVQIFCNLVQACVLLHLSKYPNGQSLEDFIVIFNIHESLLQNSLTQFSGLIKLDLQANYFINWSYEFENSSINIDPKIEINKTQIAKVIEQDRQILIEAVIVKYLKATKQSSFENLVEAVCNKISLFKPHPVNIRLATERLIKKDFLEESINGLILFKQ